MFSNLEKREVNFYTLLWAYEVQLYLKFPVLISDQTLQTVAFCVASPCSLEGDARFSE